MFHKPRAAFPMDANKPSASIVIPKSTRNPLFEETSDRAIRTAHRRKWTFFGTLGLLVGVAVGIWFWHAREQALVREMTTEYLAIEAAFGEEQQKFQDAQKAAGDKADFTKSPDHAASAQKFAEYARKYPEEPLGWQAALRASSLLIEQKKTKDAQDLLENVTRRTLKNNVAQARLRRTLAGVYADQGDYAKAISELEFAEKLPDNPVLDETRLLRAQFLYLAGRKDDAAKLLKELSASAGLDATGARSVATEASLWLGYWGL